MARPRLVIDLDAIAANWRALDALSGPAVETAAVVKADAYGLGAAPVAAALAAAGARTFFVATAEEGATLREALGPGPAILDFGGMMRGDAELVRAHDLVPCLDSRGQVADFANAPPGPALRAPDQQRHEPPRPRRPRPRGGGHPAAGPGTGPDHEPPRLRRRARTPDEPSPGRELRHAGRRPARRASQPRGHRRHPARPALPLRPRPSRHRPLRRPPLPRRPSRGFARAPGHPGPRPAPRRARRLRRGLDDLASLADRHRRRRLRRRPAPRARQAAE